MWCVVMCTDGVWTVVVVVCCAMDMATAIAIATAIDDMVYDVLPLPLLVLLPI
jgi:hypothetical protein